MVRLMIVSHGPLAGAMLESARMFFGDEVDRVSAVGLNPEDAPDTLQAAIVEEIERNDDGDGVLLFVDMFAGTPFNTAAVVIEELKESHRIVCLTGVNLPLLMEAMVDLSQMSLDELAAKLEEKAPSTFIKYAPV